MRPLSHPATRVKCILFLSRQEPLRLLCSGPSLQVRHTLRNGRAVGMQLLGTAVGGCGRYARREGRKGCGAMPSQKDALIDFRGLPFFP